MGEGGELRFGSREDQTCLMRGGVVADDALDMRLAEQFRPRHGNFMDQQIGALRMANHVFVVPGVARYDDDAAAIVDPVAVGRFYGVAMVDRERRDAQVAFSKTGPSPVNSFTVIATFSLASFSSSTRISISRA